MNSLKKRHIFVLKIPPPGKEDVNWAGEGEDEGCDNWDVHKALLLSQFEGVVWWDKSPGMRGERGGGTTSVLINPRKNGSGLAAEQESFRSVRPFVACSSTFLFEKVLL